MRFTFGRAAALAIAAATPSAAMAFFPSAPSVSVEAVSDDRRRGISWSDGEASIAAAARTSLAQDFVADVRLSALRGSDRLDGAHAGIETGLRHVSRPGPWTLEAGVVGRFFLNHARLNHMEVQGSAAHQLGPVQARLAAAYAPPQDAIGGDNLYLSASFDAGIPATPYTLYGGIGRTTGDTEDSRSARLLRPGGSYWDHRIGIERVEGPLVAGLRYSDTTIDASEAEHTGARLVAYVSIGL